MDYRDYTKLGLEREMKQLDFYKRSTRNKLDDELRIKTRSDGRKELYVKRAGGSLEYVSKRNAREAAGILNYHRACAMVEVLERAIAARKALIQNYLPPTSESIDLVVKDAYRSDVAQLIGAKDKTIRVRDKRLEICKTPSDNTFDRKHLTQQTKFGLNVRSRIEVLIAEALFDAGVIFRYEEELKLYDEKGRQQIRYPDFTIHCSNGQKIYWEHAGMYENADYAAHHDEKIRLYHLNDIFEPTNLIVTKESKDHVIDMEGVWRVINGLILPIV